MPKHEILFLVVSYLLGAVPFGFILFYLTDKKDIRKYGSGNIGAANVMRLKGKTAALITLSLDMLKGVLPILYGFQHFDSPVILICGGVVAVIGHLFPIYLKCKGGKGVATFLGMLIAFHFPSAVFFAAAYLVIYYFTRYASASSLAAISAAFFAILFTHTAEVSMIFLAIVLIIVIKHHENIKRIINGTENQLIWKKK